MKYVLVSYEVNPESKDPELNAFGPFNSKQETHDYADEFGGAWNGYNVVKLIKPEY